VIEKNFELSEYGSLSLIPSPVNRMTESFALDFREGVDINLGVGYVNDKTIPSEKLIEAFKAVTSDPVTYRNALNYGGAEGSPNLIRSIKSYYKNNTIGNVPPEVIDNAQLIVGANGATSILEAIADVLPKGIVLTADPSYYIYTETLERKGFQVVSIPEENDGIDVASFEKVLNETKAEALSFVYLVTVNNPSCTILANEKRRQVVDAVHAYSKTHNKLIPIFFDKAYEHIIYNGYKTQSMLAKNELGNVFEIGTLSKILAPALRLGYMYCSKSNFTKSLIQKISDVGFSAPLINQEIASYFLDHYMAEQLKNVCDEYKAKSEVVLKALHENLHSYLENINGGGAGFYYYLTFKNVETCEGSLFNRYLSRSTGDNSIDLDEAGEKKPRLIYIPGEFCVNPKGSIVEKGKRQLRISFGFETVERVVESIELIKEACEYASKI